MPVRFVEHESASGVSVDVVITANTKVEGVTLKRESWATGKTRREADNRLYDAIRQAVETRRSAQPPNARVDLA